MPPFVVCRRAHLTSPTLLISRLTKHDSQPCDERFDLKIDLRCHLALSVTSQPHKVRVPSAPSPHPQPHNPRAITNGISGGALTKNTAKQRLSGRQPCDERVRSIIRLLRQLERLHDSHVTSQPHKPPHKPPHKSPTSSPPRAPLKEQGRQRSLQNLVKSAPQPLSR
jgi:hypothetical protein